MHAILRPSTKHCTQQLRALPFVFSPDLTINRGERYSPKCAGKAIPSVRRAHTKARHQRHTKLLIYLLMEKLTSRWVNPEPLASVRRSWVYLTPNTMLLVIWVICPWQCSIASSELNVEPWMHDRHKRKGGGDSLKAMC